MLRRRRRRGRRRRRRRRLRQRLVLLLLGGGDVAHGSEGGFDTRLQLVERFVAYDSCKRRVRGVWEA